MALRILVTGTSGFVGRAVSDHLRGLGHDVVGTVNARPGHPDDVAVDIRDEAALEARIEGRFDVVVHGAAKLGTARFDRAMRQVNVEGTRHVLAFAKRRGAAHFVHISSIAAYGARAVGEDRREDTPLASRWPNPAETEYLRSKAAAERVVVAGDVPYTILRMPVVLGAGSSFAGPAILPSLREGVVPYLVRRDRRVSVLCVGNAGPIVEAVIAAGPAQRAYNTCDHHVPWDTLLAMYGAALGRPLDFRRVGFLEVARRVLDGHFGFLVFNGYLGAHFPSDDLDRDRPFHRLQSLEQAVADEVRAGLEHG